MTQSEPFDFCTDSLDALDGFDAFDGLIALTINHALLQ